MSETRQMHRRTFLSTGLALGAAAAVVAPRSFAQTPTGPAVTDAQRLTDLKLLLAQASRILESEGVLTGPGHVSPRHPLRPDRYLTSRVGPQRYVVPADILEFELDSNPIAPLG